MDNAAIGRIATPDLTTDTSALLQRYGTNDDVVFFLGRLIWQGEMTGCVPALMDIATNSSRGLYVRIASIRGVMSIGSDAQKDSLWKEIVRPPSPLDRRILAELLEWAAPTKRSVELLLHTLERVSPFDRFRTTGLERAVHAFIAEDQPLDRLVEGLNAFLSREPLIERDVCEISKDFTWLMAPSVHAVDRLVAARSSRALLPHAIAIMRTMPVVHFMQGDDFSKYKLSLGRNVPRWRELNDLLYWTSIKGARETLAKKGRPLTDDWEIAFVGHVWRFEAEDFERCLNWVGNKKDVDDRLVALSRCITLYVQMDRPAAWLDLMHAAVRGDVRLETVLHVRLEPTPSPLMEKFNAKRSELERQHEAHARQEELGRADWVRELKANPDRVRHPVGLPPGEFSWVQYNLFQITSRGGLAVDRMDEANWRRLIPEFGEAVANAYRDAALAHWRAYKPSLQSEGAEPSSIPVSLIFAMAGISIEAGEDSSFGRRLTSDEARHAFRYITRELNGFPNWLEPLYRAHPAIGIEALTKELIWELEHSVAGEPRHHILHDILYHAPWLHAEVAPIILDWLGQHDTPDSDRLRYCHNILTDGGTTPSALAKLAGEKINGSSPADQQPRWFALFVHTDSAVAIPALEAKLEALPPEEASAFAQQFAVGLLGDRHGSGTKLSAYRNARDLKRLYILMHRYIRAADDIHRAGNGVYSPTLRDNAQEARNTLFNMLASVPGAEAYAAIKALEEEHPEPDYRRWMGRRARERAIVDADEPPWTVEQVVAFQKATPKDIPAHSS